MQSKEASCSADRCIILRYLVDVEREMTAPVGIVLSNQDEGRLWFRLPREGEEVEGIPISTAIPYLEMARDQIEAWSRGTSLPYTPASPTPLSAEWWEQVRRLMPWAVRLDPVRTIDCRTADEEIESLYEFYVRPISPAMAQSASSEPTFSRDIEEEASPNEPAVAATGVPG